jgi:hypothetical protein
MSLRVCRWPEFQLHRTSFFLIGFYTLSLVCVVLILKFGVLSAVNPPSKTLRGMFVLASGIAGIAGGAITVFFWKPTKYFIGAWGGFAFGLWIQCFRDGGLITPVGLRWVMYLGTTACHDHRTKISLTFWILCRVYCGRLYFVHNPEISLAYFACIDSLRGGLCFHARCGLLHNGGAQRGWPTSSLAPLVNRLIVPPVLHVESRLYFPLSQVR